MSRLEPTRAALYITTTASGTESGWIRYVSDVKNGAIIVGSGNGSASGWRNRGEYVAVSGFMIDGSGSKAASWRIGLYSDASHNIFSNNTVHDILTDPTAFAAASANGSGGAGVELDHYYGAFDGTMDGNTVYNIGPAGQTSSLVHGIYQSTPGIIENNVVYNTAGVGIHMWHGANHITVVNNTVDGASNVGILVGSGDSGSSSTTGDYIIVENNIVTNSNGGIYEEGITGIHNQYTDNLFFNNTALNYSLQHGLTATGTIIANPQFVDPGAHDYHLLAGSPAIDTGTSYLAPNTDLDGHTRMQGAGYDIGAYEFMTAVAGHGRHR
jgi:hypothetical protein